MTYATLPAIIGPVIGPLLGGYLTTTLSWRWISALTAPLVRVIVGGALRRLGFRALLLVSAVACAASLASFTLIDAHTGQVWIAVTIVLYGLVRSTQFMTSNTLAYADIAPQRLSRATSLGGLLQQLTVSFGVSLGAAWLGVLAPHHMLPTLANFHAVFLFLAVLPLLSLPAFARLKPRDGAIVSGHVVAERGEGL